jgi:hypothetical protein
VPTPVRCALPAALATLLGGCDGCLPELPDPSDTGAADTWSPWPDDVDLPDAPLDTGIDDGDTADPPDVPVDTVELEPPDPPPPTLRDLSARVFAPRCASCHIEQVSGGLWLAPDDELRNRLIGPAVQLPTMARVTPTDASRSYLWLKVTGTHLDAGGSGDRMPLGSTLGDDELALIYDWIEAGAPP